MNFYFSLVAFLLLSRCIRGISGQAKSMESVPDLQNSMYKLVDASPCVRLLNLSGEIGCANPGRDKVVAPVVRYQTGIDLTLPSAVLVSFDGIGELFDRWIFCVFYRISKDAVLLKNIGGILVESGTDTRSKLKGFSPDSKFPQAEFSPYQKTDYEWNPIGSGMMWKNYDFPIFLLTENSTQIMKEISLKNEKNSKGYTSNMAEFDLVMQTTKYGTHDSESCLLEGTCLPLGGYSVWSSLPPINISSSNKAKPAILTVASMDAASFFRDRSLGAESPISGLIALLAAVDSLSQVDGLGDLEKQLVFAVFTGEAWGYLGSRRFLLELDLQSDAITGLDNQLIETVIEIGSVGKAFNQGTKTFFAHTAGVSSAKNTTSSALKRAQISLESQNISVSLASSSNPGIPPSSLMSFLKKNSSTSGFVLEDFDAAFSNNFYRSHLDDNSNINSSSIVAAASLLARTLFILANDKKNVSSSVLNSINVNASLVEEMVSCLLTCDPGLSCDLVSNYISTAATCPVHYVGVFPGEPSATPDTGSINVVSRFIWNFLADKTSVLKESSYSNCSQDCSKKGEVCVKAETEGVCVTSTTRYVPAYSTRLKYESGVWTVMPPNSSDSMAKADPVWTESYWDVTGLRVYEVQDANFDRLVLLAGIAVTMLAYIAIVITRAFITKALKRD
ncbi:At3g52640/At3g52650 [Linum grandiflorum]